MNSDVIIIGGGVIGCAIAVELALNNIKVALFERNQLGQEASWASAGMLAPQSEAQYGDPLFHLGQASRNIYFNYSERLRAYTGIDPCYRNEGSLQLAFDEPTAQNMEEAHTWQFDAGLNITRLSTDEVRKLEPAISAEVMLAHLFADEHQIDNRKMMQMLIAALDRAGVSINLGMTVSEIIIEQGEVRGIIANGERFLAHKVIIAAGSWSGLLRAEPVQMPQTMPVKGQMLALKTAPQNLNYVLRAQHSYLVPRHDGTVIIGATSESVGYDKRVTGEGLQQLLLRAQQIAPILKQATFIEAWAGLRPGTADGLPILGEDAQLKGLIFATGHYRNGMLLTPITAQIIKELIISGKTSVDLKPFSPMRFNEGRVIDQIKPGAIGKGTC